MFKPRDLFDLYMAMRTRATVEIDGLVGAVESVAVRDRQELRFCEPV